MEDMDEVATSLDIIRGYLVADKNEDQTDEIEAAIEVLAGQIINDHSTLAEQIATLQETVRAQQIQIDGMQKILIGQAPARPQAPVPQQVEVPKPPSTEQIEPIVIDSGSEDWLGSKVMYHQCGYQLWHSPATSRYYDVSQDDVVLLTACPRCNKALTSTIDQALRNALEGLTEAVTQYHVYATFPAWAGDDCRYCNKVDHLPDCPYLIAERNIINQINIAHSLLDSSEGA